MKGTISNYAKLILTDGWRVAPLLKVEQTDEDALTLTWSTAGEATSYRIYATGCKPAKVTLKAAACRSGVNTYTYTYTGLAEGNYSFQV